MSTTKTKLLSSVPAVAAVAEGDKIPIVNSSGQTVLVPLSGLLSAVKVGGRNLVRSTIYSADIPGARHTNGHVLTKSFAAGMKYTSRIQLTDSIKDSGFYATSFWIKTTGATIILPNIDIIDCPIKDNITIGPDWMYFEFVVKVSNDNVGRYGFMDFEVPNSHENEVIISDLTVVRGNVPLQEWVPAPEDWGGVKPSSLAIYTLAAQLSKEKGGPLHEYIDNTDENAAKSAAISSVSSGVDRRTSAICRHLWEPVKVTFALNSGRNYGRCRNGSEGFQSIHNSGHISNERQRKPAELSSRNTMLLCCPRSVQKICLSVPSYNDYLRQHRSAGVKRPWQNLDELACDVTRKEVAA